MARILAPTIRLLAASAVLCNPGVCLAQDTETSYSISYLESFGPIAFFILGLSVLGTAVFIERGAALYLGNRLKVSAFLTKVVRHVEERHYREALDACNLSTRHPLVPAVRAGVLRANRREREIERAMHKERLAALWRLEKRISFVALLAKTALLTGLLGSILGFMQVFDNVKPTASDGQVAIFFAIAQTLPTFALGLLVAAPLFLFHHLLTQRQHKIVAEVEEGISAVLVALAGRPGN